MPHGVNPIWQRQYTGPVFRKYSGTEHWPEVAQSYIDRQSRLAVDFCLQMMDNLQLLQYAVQTPITLPNGDHGAIYTQVIKGAFGNPIVRSLVELPPRPIKEPEEEPEYIGGLYVWSIKGEGDVAFCLEPNPDMTVDGELLGTAGTWRLFKLTEFPEVARGRLMSSIATTTGVANIVEKSPDPPAEFPEYPAATTPTSPWGFKRTDPDGEGRDYIDTSTLYAYGDKGVELDVEWPTDIGILSCYYQDSLLVIDTEYHYAFEYLDMEGTWQVLDDGESFLMNRRDIIQDAFIAGTPKTYSTEPADGSVTIVYNISYDGRQYYTFTLRRTTTEFPFTDIYDETSYSYSWSGGGRIDHSTETWSILQSPYDVIYSRTDMAGYQAGDVWDQYWGRAPYGEIYDWMRAQGLARIMGTTNNRVVPPSREVIYGPMGIVGEYSGYSLIGTGIYDSEGRYVRTDIQGPTSNVGSTTWNDETAPFNVTDFFNESSGLYEARLPTLCATETVDGCIVFIESVQYQYYGEDYYSDHHEFTYWGLYNGEATDITDLLTTNNAGLWITYDPSYTESEEGGWPVTDDWPLAFEGIRPPYNNRIFMAITRPYAGTAPS